jgi:hypothetical protein
VEAKTIYLGAGFNVKSSSISLLAKVSLSFVKVKASSIRPCKIGYLFNKKFYSKLIKQHPLVNLTALTG